MNDIGRRPQIGVTVKRGLDPHFVAEQGEPQAFVPMAGQGGTGHHHTHAFVPAHRVDCDSRLSGHCQVTPLRSREWAQAPTATTSRPL